MKKIRVAMIAPPWLPIPPEGYGGIENVVHSLVLELMNLGVEVELFTTGDSKIKSTRNHSIYAVNQYHHVLRPQYDTGPIMTAHLLYAINTILEDGNFDVIHDHNNYVGPLAFARATEKLPPVIHTLHNPSFVHPTNDASLPTTAQMWQEVSKAKKMHFVSLSDSMQKTAPASLEPLMLSPVHNSVNPADFPFRRKKDNYFITLARFHPDKGHHVAIQASLALGVQLKMAGVVNDLRTHNQVLMELANPFSTYRSLLDFRYFSDQIFPSLLEDSIEHVGEVSGQRKLDFISHAKALLFPILWDEPFGMAVIEALACGTPVIAMNRGVMPEIIVHGYNGFLANNIEEFKDCMTKIDDIDPANCRRSVEENFSAAGMAKNYLRHYETAIKKYKNPRLTKGSRKVLY